MANIASFPLSFTIIGDGVSLTAAVAVDPTPTAVTLGQVRNSSGVDVSSNVVSAVLVGSTVNFTFNAAFTGAISVSISLAYPSTSNAIVVTNFPATQPVSGTFFPGTQPVSIATMPSTPVTGTFFQGTQPVSGAFYQATQPVSLASTTVTGSVAVTGAFWQATQPVSGTFWQATQPVSIASMPTTSVTGTFWQATQPVSGVFFQVTQPVSIATMPTTPVIGTFWQATQPVSVPSITKGTQGSTGITVQNLKDAGRTAVTFFLDDISGSLTEVLATMSITKGAVAQTPATSYTVTAGKTLRLSSINLSVRSSTNAAQMSKIRIRTAASGITATSPVILNFIGEAPAAATQSQSVGFEDGYEVAGGTQIAISHIENITPASTQLTVCLVGYEY
jgi:hypothetical protein